MGQYLFIEAMLLDEVRNRNLKISDKIKLPFLKTLQSSKKCFNINLFLETHCKHGRFCAGY